MNFHHSGSLGDIVYSIPSIHSIIKQREPLGKANLYLRPDIQDSIPSWAGTRPPLRVSKTEIEKLLPLLEGQGLGEVALYKNNHIDIDLDDFRKGGNTDRGDICLYYSRIFACDPCLDYPWLFVKPSNVFRGCVLVNRTLRYLNSGINYKFLADKSNVVFVGYPEEYAAFSKSCPGMPHIQAINARQLASWIAGAKGFIGNQSFCFSLAEAMKVPRLLEIYPRCANVVIHGPNGWAASNQAVFEEVALTLCKLNCTKSGRKQIITRSNNESSYPNAIHL